MVLISIRNICIDVHVLRCEWKFIISIMMVLRVVEINIEGEMPLSLSSHILGKIVFEGCNCLIGLLLANQLVVIIQLVCNNTIHSHVLN